MPQITVSASQGPTGTTSSVSARLWRRVFQGGRPRSRPTTNNAPSVRRFHSLAAPPNINKPLPAPVPEVAHNLSSFQMTPTPPRKQRPKPPEWSVVYHPKVRRALNLRLAQSFTYDSPVYCVKMSPDGRRLAVGGDEKTYLYELETGSNIWLVSESFFKNCIDAIDPSIFVDRYVRDYRFSIDIVQFTPDGQLLATGASDGQIRVCSLRMRIFIILISTLLRYGISP